MKLTASCMNRTLSDNDLTASKSTLDLEIFISQVIKMNFFLCIALLSVSISSSSGIYNGERVPKGELSRSFVHFGAYPREDKPEYICGGVLITWSHVLTSAKCKVDPIHHYAYIGGRRLFSSHTPYVSALRSVELHKKFEEDRDLAIVELRGASRTEMRKRNIAPVEIDFRIGRQALGIRLIAIGFGQTDVCEEGDNGCDISSRLRSGAFKLQDIQKCKHENVSTDRRKTVCMKSSKRAVCEDDIGGPVFSYRADDDDSEPKLYLAGILSGVVRRGRGSSAVCVPGAPVVATGLQGLRPWLRKRTGKFSRW